MDNYTWRDTELKVSDLPAKEQRFIEVMELDVSQGAGGYSSPRPLKFLLLQADPDGKYIKDFGNDGKANAVYHRLENIIYFIERVRVGDAIHELTHFYLDTVPGNDVTEETHGIYEKAIGESFIKQYGLHALSNYASVSMIHDEWSEVVCEIAAVFGRRGQFDKIKELFNK